MIAFVRDMSDGFKKTSHLKEAIRRSWVPGSPDHRCPESSNGNTVLHVAARMGEAKVGTVANRLMLIQCQCWAQEWVYVL